jgi:hypothetical protein
MSDIYLKQNWTTALIMHKEVWTTKDMGWKIKSVLSNLKLSELYQKPVILLNPLNIIKIISFIG